MQRNHARAWPATEGCACAEKVCESLASLTLFVEHPTGRITRVWPATEGCACAEKVCESLASLTLHVDSNASSTAVSTLHSLMYCRPSSRNAITQATIHLMHRIPVEFSGSVLATMDLLVALMTVRYCQISVHEPGLECDTFLHHAVLLLHDSSMLVSVV